MNQGGSIKTVSKLTMLLPFVVIMLLTACDQSNESFSRNDEESLTIAININISPLASGTATGEGKYLVNDVVTLTATPATGYSFVNWTVAGAVVSTSNSYSFSATEDRSLLANFIVNNGSNQPVVIDENYPPVSGSWYRPEISTTWQWQLSGDINTGYDVALYDIDLFDAANKILELQNLGKKVICYFSAGSAENWRTDYDNFNPEDMGNALEGWQSEKWLDIRSDNVKAVMQARLTRAVSQGCDGVEPDNMDGYINVSGFNLTAEDQLAYNRFIANEAHLRGLSVALKNDVDQIGALVEYFDFAVNEQCFQYSECDDYKIFTDRNKPVLNAEYPEKDASLNNASNQAALCQRAVAANIHTLMLPLNLNDAFRISCD